MVPTPRYISPAANSLNSRIAECQSKWKNHVAIMAEENSAEDHGSWIVWTHNLTEAETSDAKTEKDDRNNLMVCDDTQANELQFPDLVDGASLEAASV